MVRGKDRAVWHYVLLVDDEGIIEMFLQTVQSGNVDLADFGEVIKSGWGQNPPDDVKEWIQKKYKTNV